MTRGKNNKPDILFAVAREAIPHSGEDSWCYSVQNNATLIGVFDGSGGIGGRKYENYSGKSGAYVISRAVSGVVAEWFHAGCDAPLSDPVNQALSICKKYADPEVGLKGSMRKDFPTTLAMMTLAADNNVEIHCYWVGDSRCYILEKDGLHQITSDDVNTSDPMTNLTEDGVLTNVINASTRFVIHEKTLKQDKPCIMISATDGCFGYLPSPMHFEYMLLDTLEKANSLKEWKVRIDSTLQSCAGDDYSMCVAGFGFLSYADIQDCFAPRLNRLSFELIGKSKPELQKIWDSYKNNYMWIS